MLTCLSNQMEIGSHHAFDELREGHLRYPAENLCRFRRITNQQVHFRRTHKTLVFEHVASIVYKGFADRTACARFVVLHGPCRTSPTRKLGRSESPGQRSE